MRNNDINCPYCNEELEIDHDDGRGYAEDELHQQQCEHCEKTFVFTTYVSHSYDASKADCLNEGGEHIYEPTTTSPKFFTKMRCLECGEERELTKEERDIHNIPHTLILN